MIYCDTSLLFSFLVGDELEIEAIQQLDTLTENPDFLCWTAWHGLEIQTALERHVANPHKLTSREDAEAIYEQIVEWQKPGGLLKVVIPDWQNAMIGAQSIAARSAARHGARSLDNVHVALARQLEVREFWSFDKRQRGMAEDWGLIVNELKSGEVV